MNRETRAIVNFWELPEIWQREAIRNLDDEAEDAMYLEPLETENPDKHVLWDLTECFPVQGEEYNAIISVCNTAAIALEINDTFESAEIWMLY